MEAIFGLAVWAAIYPTLLACVVVILLLPRPERLLLGFWLGAMAMSLTCGLIVVFALGGSSGATTTTRHAISPIAEITLGAILLLLALVFFSGRDQRYNARMERRREKQAKKPPSKMMKLLRRGTPRTTFVVGAVIIGIPGVSYLTAMDPAGPTACVDLRRGARRARLERHHAAAAGGPDRRLCVRAWGHVHGGHRFRNWLTRDEARIAYWCALLAGAALLAIGVVHLVR